MTESQKLGVFKQSHREFQCVDPTANNTTR